MADPAALLENQLTIVDTPGVNDINEQRAEITYGYMPRADAVVFLLDGAQILTRPSGVPGGADPALDARPDLLFVIAKTDLLAPDELDETLRVRAQAPGGDRPRAGDLPGVGQARAGRAIAR